MNTTIFTTTQSGNNYYIDIKKQFVGYAHPILSFLDKYKKRFKTFDNILDNFEIENFGRVENELLQYYIGKHNFLTENGLNRILENGENTEGEITAEMIDYEIANLDQLTFEVTDSCNLNCKYCGYNDFYFDFDNRNNRKLSFDLAKRIIDYVVKKWNSPLNSSYNGISFISFYGGEPLLCVPLIEKIIKYINSIKINRKIRYSMTSNGLLLDRYESFLVENDIKVLISIDGNEYNNSYRVDHTGAPSFKKLYNNIKHLEEKFPEYFKENVSFNSVLHDKNSTQDIFSFISREFQKIPSISPLNNSGIREDKRKDFMKLYKNKKEDLEQSEHYEKISNELGFGAPAIASLSIFLKQYSGVFYNSYSDLLENSESDLFIPTGTCIPFSKKMFVTVNGKILPCESIGHRFVHGVVKKEVVEINTKLISKKFNYYLRKLKDKCSSCYKSHSCIQCLFNLDDIDDNKPKCKGFYNLNSFTNYFKDNITYLEKHPVLYNTIIKKFVLT